MKNGGKIVKNSVERMLPHMKKRIISLIMSVCLLVTLFVCFASAAAVEVDQTLPTIIRLCPGEVIGQTTDDVLPPPTVYGSVYQQGWEIKVEGGNWVPYENQPLDETYDGAVLRYFAVPFSNDETEYAYSNECELIVKHNPTGSYIYSGTDHWRVCADCGQKDGEELHSFFDAADPKDTVCKVCGAKRTSQWTGLAAFFDWLFATIFSLFL